MVRGIDLTLGKIPLRPIVEGIDPTLRRSPTSIDVGGRGDQERRIPILRWTGIRLEVGGIRQTVIPMVKQAQQTGDRPVAAYIQYSSDDLDIEVIHPS